MTAGTLQLFKKEIVKDGESCAQYYISMEQMGSFCILESFASLHIGGKGVGIKAMLI